MRKQKLLVLGANPETAGLVNIAKEMGIYTIVTDYDPEAAAKKVADKSYDVDGLDIDGLVELAQKENVEGILLGVADPLICAYQKACERLNLPCYITEKQINIFTNKFNLKRELEKYGLSGIPEFKLDAYLHQNDLKNIKYPVLVKPVDSNSGKGMTICKDESQIADAVTKALECSLSKHFIVEKYMTCDDMFVYYTFKGGYYSLSAIADRFTSKEQGALSPVCLGGVYPSKYQKLYYDTVHEKICKMFSDLKVKNGILMITAFVEDRKFFFYDPGFRLQGEAPHILINAVNGFDQRKMLINFALSGSMGNVDLEKVDDSNFKNRDAASIWFLLKKGIIKTVKGIDKIKKLPQVVHIVQRFNEGDIVKEEFIGTEKQVFARIYVVCNSKEEFRQVDRTIQDAIEIKDTDRDNMLLSGFNPDIAWKTGEAIS